MDQNFDYFIKCLKKACENMTDVSYFQIIKQWVK